MPDLVFSFDTTGSMSSCIADVRSNVEKMCHDLFVDILNLRIGLIAHGDYYDGPLAITLLPLTNDPEKIKEFFKTTPNTAGGDWPECYELALHTARSLGWLDKSRMMVLIGDCEPHTPDFPENTLHLDWRIELDALKELGVRVYPLQCLYHPSGDPFYKEVAEKHGTPLLRLQNIASASFEMLMGYAYALAGETIFEKWEATSPEAQAAREVLKEEASKYNKE
jgi:hypothetical protein